jgi:hypothetical protein
MRRWTVAACTALVSGAILVALASCGNDPMEPGSTGIAGQYTLAAVDGQTPPCCGADSTGAIVSIAGGTLTLADAAPEQYAFTPAGIAMATLCIHQIPNGAYVDTADVVHLPDGSSYKIPSCGDAPYTLILVYRQLLPDGSSGTVADTTSGLYTWGSVPGADAAGADLGGASPADVTLVGSGMGGTVAMSAAGVEIRIAKRYIGPQTTHPGDHQYTFRK